MSIGIVTVAMILVLLTVVMSSSRASHGTSSSCKSSITMTMANWNWLTCHRWIRSERILRIDVWVVPRVLTICGMYRRSRACVMIALTH